MAAQQADQQRPTILAPVTPAVRHRLQTVFEHGQRCGEKGDHDYAHDLLTQCVVEDPGNLIYLQHLLANLAQKYGNSKKGSKLSGLKSKSARMSLNKATGKGQWNEAFHAACDALKHNPWDITTLLAIADAYEQIGCQECQLYVLRWALDVDPKDVTVNRRAGQALAAMGQFDQAISCWQRVVKAKPLDEEAQKAIAQLSVEQTIHQGGYNAEILGGGQVDLSQLEASVRERIGQGQQARAPQPTGDQTEEQREQALADAMAAQPAELSNYLELADMLTTQHRLREAEQVLSRALSAAGGGDLNVRERLEDAQLRHAHQQLEIANRRAREEATAEAADLARRMAIQSNQLELEVYAARSAREPQNLLLQYELGLRLKRAGKYKEAIQAFQGARDVPKHKALVQLHLGESFQHIHQFKLALASYEAAIQASDTLQADIHKLALYRAGVLAADLNDVSRAERHLTNLAAVDFGYRDVAERLDKLASLRDSV
jgi:tetratricopeptide (TPR) repeat protein